MWPDHRWDPIYPLMYGKGLLSNEPLYNLIYNITSQKTMKKRVVVSAVDAISGNYIPYALHEMGDDNAQKASAVVGSSSMPVIFPPRNMSEFGEDTLLIDGGSVWNNNLLSGIEQCRQIPGILHDDQIEVDVVMLTAEKLERFDPAKGKVGMENKKVYVENLLDRCMKKGNDKDACLELSFMPETLKFLSRKNDIKAYFKNVADIVEFMDSYPDVQYRYYIKPEVTLLPEYEILEFGIEYTGKLIELGRNDTQRTIDMGPGVSFNNLINIDAVGQEKEQV